MAIMAHLAQENQPLMNVITSVGSPDQWRKYFLEGQRLEISVRKLSCVRNEQGLFLFLQQFFFLPVNAFQNVELLSFMQGFILLKERN